MIWSCFRWVLVWSGLRLWFLLLFKKKRSSGDEMLWKMISRWFWYYLRYFVEGFMIWCFLCVCVCAPPRARAWIDLIVEVWFGKKYEFCCLKFASSLLMLRFGTHVIFLLSKLKNLECELVSMVNYGDGWLLVRTGKQAAWLLKLGGYCLWGRYGSQKSNLAAPSGYIVHLVRPK